MPSGRLAKRTGRRKGAIRTLSFEKLFLGSERVDARLADGHCSFLEGLADGRVGKAGAGDIFGAAAVFHMSAGGGNHFRGALGDHLDAEKFVGLGAGDDLDETVSAVGSNRAAVAGEMELTDGDLDILGLGLGFGETDAGDFGVGVDDARDDGVVHVAMLTGEVLGDGNALVFGLVGEHGAGDDVTDGVDAWKVGLEMRVDDDAAAFIELEAGFLGAEAGRISLAANGDEDLVGHKFEGLTIAFDRKGGTRGTLFHAGDLGAHLEFNPLFLKSTLRGLGDVRVIGRSADGRQHLDDGDLRAETGPDGTELKADGAGTDDDHLFGDGLQRDAVVGRDNGFSVELHEGQFDRHGTRSDEDVLCFESTIASRTADENFTRLSETTETAHNLNVTLLEEGADAHVQLGDNLVFIREHRRDIESNLLGTNQAVLLAVSGVLVDFGGMEERLGRNAADIEAGAAEGVVLFHESHLETELAGLDGGDIATGTGTDYDEIELRH